MTVELQLPKGVTEDDVPRLNALWKDNRDQFFEEVEKLSPGSIARYKKSISKEVSQQAIAPHTNAGRTLTYTAPPIEVEGKRWQHTNEALAETLKQGTERLRKNDITELEDTLYCQVKTLDALFHKFIVLTIEEAKTEPAIKLFTDIALKAQRQARAAAETIALIKNPQPIQNIRQQNLQQNVAQQQIVNNGEPHAGEFQKPSNELLSDRRGEYEIMDTGRPKAAGRADKELEAVGARHRTEDA